MKKLFIASLVAGACSLTALPTYAQTDNNAVVEEASINSIINILDNVTADTTPDELRKELVEAINRICKNKEEVKLENKVNTDSCGASDIDAMINAVVSRFGADNPLISDFLAALTAAGLDTDAITLSAITAGVDATIASQATAAGPTGAGPAPAGGDELPAIVSLPVPQGGGGTGGDAGISEVGN